MNELQQIIERRNRVVEAYCKKMGWSSDPAKLSIDQLMEIRSQKEWKEAGIHDTKEKVG